MRIERHITASPVEAQCCLDGYLSHDPDPDIRAYVDPLFPWILVLEFLDEDGPPQETCWTDEHPGCHPRFDPARN